MKIAIIGRTEVLYDCAIRLVNAGHQIACILTAKEAPEYTRSAADYRELAGALQVPFAQGGRIAEHIDFLRSAQADIGVSINYTGVVPQSVIDLFPFGVLNAHGGDLPRYRGNACQAWAILNGESRIGLCIHRMVGGELDSGDIIARDYLAINYRTKITAVWEWMFRRTPELMLEAVQRLAVDSAYILERQSRDPKDALRCYPRKPEDGRIDWQRPAIDVLRLINASNKPYAGAFCRFGEEKVIIWDADLSEDEEHFLAIPGQVTRLFPNGSVEIACGKGKIILSRIQSGVREISPTELIKSARDRLA